MKKEEVIDKSYVLELESKINHLQSTIDMYKTLENRGKAEEKWIMGKVLKMTEIVKVCTEVVISVGISAAMNYQKKN